MLLGSLDHPEDWPFVPGAVWGSVAHVCVESKIPWYEIADGLPQKTSEMLPAMASAQSEAEIP